MLPSNDSLEETLNVTLNCETKYFVKVGYSLRMLCLSNSNNRQLQLKRSLIVQLLAPCFPPLLVIDQFSFLISCKHYIRIPTRVAVTAWEPSKYTVCTSGEILVYFLCVPMLPICLGILLVNTEHLSDFSKEMSSYKHKYICMQILVLPSVQL